MDRIKICLIGAIREDADINKIVGYGQVLPWWLRDGIRKHGHEAFLWSDKDLGQELPPSDVVISISGQALITMRRDREIFDIVSRSTGRVCELTDGPSRSIMDWNRNKYAGAYFGLGASPEHCYPAQDPSRRVILFNGWNLPLENPAHLDRLMEPALEAMRLAQAGGWEVWSMNAQIPWADRSFGRAVEGRQRTTYIPWVEYCAIMRQGSVFFDTTNKVVELGRTEAAVAGNVIMAPRYNQTSEEWIDGVRYLRQVLFDETDATEQLFAAMALADDADRIHRRALDYFNWSSVAKRILDFLFIPQREMGLALSKRPAVTIDGKEWIEAEQIVESPSAAKAAPPKEIPWVQCPLQVPPSMLYWQDGAIGPKPLEESAHVKGAYQMVRGWKPDGTEYALQIKTQQSGCHGRPAKFADLVESMKSGWKGKPIIAWINRRGEIVIHDGWHRAAAAWAVELDTIPVSIHGRDEDWIAFRHAAADLNNGRKLYQPIFHPDFEGWKCWRKDTKARISQISEWLMSVNVRTVCDLGCHAGTVSHGLARLGFEVHGVDQNPLAVAVASLAADMTDIGSTAIFEVGSKGQTDDATVCLSAINHQLVTDTDKAGKMLAEIAACSKYLVTDCPTPGDPVGGDTEWSDSERMIAWLEVSGWRLLDRKDRGAELQRTLLFLERS